MKKLASLIIMLFAMTAVAQTEKQILGKWQFVSLADTPDMDAETKEMAGAIFKDFALQFDADKKVTFSMMGKSESGKWSYNEADKTIVMVSAKDKTITIPITKFSETEMTVNFQNKASMILKRG